MRYIPHSNDNDESVEESGFNPRSLPTAETTKYLRWGTEVETTNITNEDFINRHPNLVRMVSKWLPLGNFGNGKQKQIERIRRYEVSLMEAAGLFEDAEEVTIDTIGDTQFSRGQGGFFTKENNTIRQKIKDETERPKHRRISFFKQNDHQEEME